MVWIGVNDRLYILYTPGHETVYLVLEYGKSGTFFPSAMCGNQPITLKEIIGNCSW